MKQEPAPVEQSYSETIAKSRLDACTEMNLFTNLLDAKNLVAAFDCTEWDKQFPVIRSQLSQFNRENWNNILLPISKYALNDREILRKNIAVTQVLEEQGGLEDFGRVMDALSDNNFYDGMNELFQCANGEACTREQAPSKEEIIDAFGVLEVLREQASQLQVVFVNAIAAMNVLSSSFQEEVSRVLSAPEFISKRIEFLDLVIKYITEPKNEFERRLLPALLSVDEGKGNSIFDWINSNEFNSQLLKELVDFEINHPLAIKDLRSVAQLRDQSLKCDRGSRAGFFIDIDQHLLLLLTKMSTLETHEFESYLADDLAAHQVAMQACEEFKSLAVEIDGEPHSLDVVRMKKSMINFLRIPGVMNLSKVIARRTIDAANGNKSELGEFLAKQMSENYIGASADWLRIINAKSPKLFDEYVNYIKSLPKDVYTEATSLVDFLISKKLDRARPALSKIWFFFKPIEKNFIFNYIDRHFSPETNYKALFAYYLDIFTIYRPIFPNIIAAWCDNGMDHKNFAGLKELAERFHGADALAELRRFFSRTHILKVIELFINGERLTAWAQSVRASIPSAHINEHKFMFDSSSEVSTFQCLDELATGNIEQIIANFPATCRPMRGQVFLDKLRLIANLAADFILDHGFNAFKGSGLLNQRIIQDLIIYNKKNMDALNRHNIKLADHLLWLKKQVEKDQLRNIVESADGFLKSMPDSEQERVKRKIQTSVASILLDQDLMKGVLHESKSFSSWMRNNFWKDILTKKYPSIDLARNCKNELNQNIGGKPCPAKEEFKSFVQNFTHLLARKNNDSPLAIRQFLIAMDPQAGLPIPFKSRNPKNKVLSIRESLEMFWDLSEPTIPLNQKQITYESKDGKTQETVTTMERIEVVIRDVAFDANYLGAHYKNSVAKSNDYLKVVNAKYGMFKFCVKAGFCGKFMNRAERKMARNAIETFPSLIDVQMDGLEYGDYMKALIGSVVSSSSSASQISSIVKFKRNGDGFNIPWIQTKRQLQKHNGVILSELSSVGAFSNMARWTRDRFGREGEEVFKAFLETPKINYISKHLLEKSSASTKDEVVVKMLNALNENSELIVSDVWEFIQGLSYEDLRRAEDVVGDLLVIASALNKVNDNYAWNEILSFSTVIINNYEDFKQQWSGIALNTIFKNIQPFTSYISQRILSEDKQMEELLRLATPHVNSLFFSAEETGLLSSIGEHYVPTMAKNVVNIIKNSQELLSEFWNESDAKMLAASVEGFSDTISPDVRGFEGIAAYLQSSADRRSCIYEGEFVKCEENEQYLAPWKLVDTVVVKKENWDKYVTGVFENHDQLANWMSETLGIVILK